MCLRFDFASILLAAIVTCFSTVLVLPSRGSKIDGEQKVWTTSSFLEFSDGTLSDGGVNTYVTAGGEVRLINLWDLNNDGFLDIVFPNTHDNNQQVELSIYWGVDGFGVRRRTQLPSDGGVAQVIADLNGDGYPDLVVVNGYNGVKTNLNSYIYWGTHVGFESQRRTELPTFGALAAAAADLNSDGHLDLVFANSGRVYEGSGEHSSYIYWGSAGGFSSKNFLALPTAVASDVKVADLNRDGAPDIVFANEGSGEDQGGAIIYWGSSNATFSENRKAILPGIRSSAIAITDLNQDGFAEIILANRYLPIRSPHKFDALARRGQKDRNIVTEVDTDVENEAISSYIYWGSRNGYSALQRSDLPTVAASGVAAGDLNGDGYLDVVFCNGPRRAGHSAPTAGGGSYLYWGSHQGFEIRRRTILPTLNPTHCLVDDLNGDGHPDLVFSNENDARSFHTQSYVYWGSREEFGPSRRLDLPTVGAASVGVADFDRDGMKDLVFINRIDGAAGEAVPAYVYWGNEKGEYRSDQRLSLPHPYGSPGEAYAAADLNNDGWVDLYLGGAESAVYWGSPQSFAPQRKTVVAPNMAFSSRIADFNRDGYLDLVLSEFAKAGKTDLYWGGPMGFSPHNRFTFVIDGVRRHTVADLNRDGYLDVVFPTINNAAVIFWNSSAGFDNAKKTSLPGGLVISAEIADLNRDGYLDIILCNLRSADGKPEGNTFVYWGSKEGYRESRRLVLPSVGNEDALVADLNRDGHLDLVLTSFHAGETRNHPSYIYWSSAQGFDASRVTLLPTHSASGALAADFNHDSYPDILFVCHTLEGNHRNDSFLYWGGPQGYSPERRGLLPGLGSHFMTVADIGNIYDRNDRYAYISRAFDAGRNAHFESLDWEGQTPFATRLEFQVRTAATQEDLKKTVWLGPDGPDSWYRERSSNLKGLPQDARWIQFKAILIGPDGANSPVLQSVSIKYHQPN